MRNLRFLLLAYLTHTTCLWSQEQVQVPFNDSTNILVYYIPRGVGVLNLTDTLWLLNRPSFQKYRTAHRLLFHTKDTYENLIGQMEIQDSLIYRLYEERTSAYDKMYKLNRDFYDTTRQFVQLTRDSLDRMSLNIHTVQGQLDRANQHLEVAVDYIKSAKKDRYRYLLIGLLAGGIVGYILH